MKTKFSRYPSGHGPVSRFPIGNVSVYQFSCCQAHAPVSALALTEDMTLAHVPVLHNKRHGLVGHGCDEFALALTDVMTLAHVPVLHTQRHCLVG